MIDTGSKINNAFRMTVALVVFIVIVATGVLTHYVHHNGMIYPSIRSDCEDSPHHNNVKSMEITPTAYTGPIDYTTMMPYANREHTSSKIQQIYNTDDTNSTESFNAFEIKARFDARMAQVLKVCNRSDLTDIIKGVPESKLYAFDRLTFCPIPKCGTTFMTRELLPTLKKLNETPYQKNPERFYLVREPYSRLVSAFFSKIVGHPLWWRFASEAIIKRFRPNASYFSIRCGYDATFPEFIKFIIDIHNGGTVRDPHFLRSIEVCNICADIPAFVAKLETVKDDLMYILNTVDVTGMTNKGFVEVKHLGRSFMKWYERAEGCGAVTCAILNRYWYQQQSTGLILEDIELPIKGKECENITGDKLGDLAWEAHLKSVERINKREYKKKVMKKLFQQVSLEDRQKLQRLFSLECEIYGYDPHPDFVFPES